MTMKKAPGDGGFFLGTHVDRRSFSLKASSAFPPAPKHTDGEIMDTLTPEQRSRTMARIKGKNTVPEKTVRSLLHRMGYRFRLHCKELPGKPDIVLPKYQAIIFVHGCFWHGHPGCKRATVPETRRAFWENKISANRVRDAENLVALKRLGYRCLVVWQCELNNTGILRDRLARFLGKK